MTDKDFSFSKEVERLFATIEKDEKQSEDHLPCHEIGVRDYSEDLERQLDHWRILLTDAMHQFGAAISAEHSMRNPKEKEIQIIRFVDTLRMLDQMPDHERVILVRAKEAFFDGSRKTSADYSVFFGNIVLDFRCIDWMISRLGPRVSYLTTRLKSAFTSLARYKIRTLHIEIPKESPSEIERMRITLRILSAFHTALMTKTTAYYTVDEKELPVEIVYDENGRPNPNLTLLAALNGLKPETLKGFVEKVDTWMRRPEAQALRKQFTSIYSALFGIKKLRDRLKRPPIEINNLQWSILERVHDVLSSEKARLVRIVDKLLGVSPAEGAKIMESVYAADYDKIDPITLGERLLSASRLLSVLADDWEYEELVKEVLSNIEKRLGLVPDDVFCSINLVGDQMSVHVQNRIPLSGTLDKRLVKIINIYRKRADTKQKIKRLVKEKIKLAADDFKNIADEFNISQKKAEELVGLLSECFDSTGRFVRKNFESKIESFAAHEKYIFSFLWHYLGEIMHKDDRISFLNAIQLLISRLKIPKRAMITLLSDFCKNPLAVRYSDRNALILCSVLCRTYNKELHIDTEITPEEVLLVRDGINESVVKTASEWIENEEKRFLKKCRTIHRELKDTLQSPAINSTRMPPGFLVSLERELVIFLSLVGGETPFSIVRSLVKELGDPDSRIYKLAGSKKMLNQLIQLLQTSIRGLGRAGEKEDIQLFKLIKSRQERFISLDRENKRFVDLVKRAMRWADEAAKKA